MKNFLRNWLGINTDMQAVSQDVTTLLTFIQTNEKQLYELFHGVPFSAGVLGLTAKSAAAITQPQGVQANSLVAILMGVVLHARQGMSQFEITGELDDIVRKTLTDRGFKLEEFSGTGGKATYIIWA